MCPFNRIDKEILYFNELGLSLVMTDDGVSLLLVTRDAGQNKAVHDMVQRIIGN